MIKLTQWPEIDEDLRKELIAIPVKQRPTRWDGRTKIVLTFKNIIKDRGLEIQESRCAWCGLMVGELGRRSAHRDHIAPKKKHPAWTFYPQNIVIACEFCNGFAVKSDVETVETKSKSYVKCKFFIVHPYFDNPPDHLEFVSTAGDTKIVIKRKSDKGEWTIKALNLDSPGATSERAKDSLYRQRLADLDLVDQTRLNEALSRLGN